MLINLEPVGSETTNEAVHLIARRGPVGGANAAKSRKRAKPNLSQNLSAIVEQNAETMNKLTMFNVHRLTTGDESE